MPLVEFEILKAADIEIETIRFANTFVDPTPGADPRLNVTDTSIKTNAPIDAPTSNPILLVNIRANGPMIGLEWSFDITINGSNKTPEPIITSVGANGRADLRRGFPY